MSQLIYEGKAKKVWSEANAAQVRVEFKNSLTAFNALKKGEFAGKGAVNCEITCLLFDHLKKQGIETHLIKKISPTEIVVDKLTMIPLEVVVRNILAGSTAKKFGIEEGRRLDRPLLELFYKDDALQDPFVNDEQVLILGYVTAPELEACKKAALAINAALLPLFAKIGIDLVDFKLEFGKNAAGKVVLGDEITPDCCRLWDRQTNEKLDKDRFRRDLGKVDESYHEVLNRLKKELGQ